MDSIRLLCQAHNTVGDTSNIFQSNISDVLDVFELYVTPKDTIEKETNWHDWTLSHVECGVRKSYLKEKFNLNQNQANIVYDYTCLKEYWMHSDLSPEDQLTMLNTLVSGLQKTDPIGKAFPMKRYVECDRCDDSYTYNTVIEINEHTYDDYGGDYEYNLNMFTEFINSIRDINVVHTVNGIDVETTPPEPTGKFLEPLYFETFYPENRVDNVLFNNFNGKVVE